MTLDPVHNFEVVLTNFPVINELFAFPLGVEVEGGSFIELIDADSMAVFLDSERHFFISATSNCS